jgi:hypothetical protein
VWLFAAALGGACSPDATDGTPEERRPNQGAEDTDARASDDLSETDTRDATVTHDARPSTANDSARDAARDVADVLDPPFEDADALPTDAGADVTPDGAPAIDASRPDADTPIACGQAVVTQGRVPVRLGSREGAPTTVLDFTGRPAEVSLRHRIDVDNGGCISDVLVRVSLNDRGCRLALRFGRAQDRFFASPPDLALIGADLTLDGFCPGIPDENEDVYRGSAFGTAALTTFEGVPDRTATEACISRSFSMEGEVTTSGTRGPSFGFVTYSLGGFRVEGTFKSVGAAGDLCTCSPTAGCALCGARVEPNACGTCRPGFFGALCAYQCPPGESRRPCSGCMSGFGCKPGFTELSVGNDEVCARRDSRPPECWTRTGDTSFTAIDNAPLKTGNRYRCSAQGNTLSCGEWILQQQIADDIRSIRDFDVRGQSYCVAGELRREGGEAGLSCRGPGAIELSEDRWNAEKIAMGPRHVCGVTSGIRPDLQCDGPGVRELGIPRYTERFGSTRAASIASGALGTCVLFDDGLVRCVGPAAATLPQGTRARSVAVGQRGVCAVLSDGALRCFADDRLARVPAGAFRTVALGGPDDQPIACAIHEDGHIRCWGPGVDAGLVPARRD